MLLRILLIELAFTKHGISFFFSRIPNMVHLRLPVLYIMGWNHKNMFEAFTRYIKISVEDETKV
jgi:hypothetical protein